MPESNRGDTLFVTLNSYNDALGEVDRSRGSLLCAFPQEKLQKEFDRAMEKCRQGSSQKVRLMTRYSAINESTRFCERKDTYRSSSPDDYVESLEDVEGHFLYKLKNEVITSLASTIYRKSSNESNNLFAFGTWQGEVHRLVRQNGTRKSEIKFSPNDRIRSTEIVELNSNERSAIHGHSRQFG